MAVSSGLSSEAAEQHRTVGEDEKKAFSATDLRIYRVKSYPETDT